MRSHLFRSERRRVIAGRFSIAGLIACLSFQTQSAIAESCPTQTFATSVALGGNYETSSGTCIQTTGNLTVTLSGTVTCNATDGWCAPAVRSLSGVAELTGGGTIRGPFSVAVEDFQAVHSIKIGAGGTTGNAPLYGIVGDVIDQVDGCELSDCGVAIYGVMKDSSSWIRDNYIDADGFTAILVSGTGSGSGPRIEKNYIIDFGYGVVGGGTKLRVLDNVLTTPSGTEPEFIDGSGTWVIDGNLCLDASDCPLPAPGWQLP